MDDDTQRDRKPLTWHDVSLNTGTIPDPQPDATDATDADTNPGLAYAVPIEHLLGGLAVTFEHGDGTGYSFSLTDLDGNPVAQGGAIPSWLGDAQPNSNRSAYRLTVTWIDAGRWRLLPVRAQPDPVDQSDPDTGDPDTGDPDTGDPDTGGARGSGWRSAYRVTASPHRDAGADAPASACPAPAGHFHRHSDGSGVRHWHTDDPPGHSHGYGPAYDYDRSP